jgi:hypothetical protein
MTEDGRSSGVSGPNQFQAGGHPDAQLDAFTDSLWLDSAAGFVLPVNKPYFPRSRCVGRDMGNPHCSSITRLCISEGETL